jgi:hypothetical protein
MNGTITAPAWQILAVWLIIIAVVAMGAAALAYLAGDTHGERAAEAECARRHSRPVPPPAPSRPAQIRLWQAREREHATEPIPMWVLDAALAIVDHEHHAAGDGLHGLDRQAAATELEIRRLGDEAVRRIGAPR